MPTYEYVCSKCDCQFEVVQPITSAALTTCPKDRCGQKKWGKGKVKRAIGAGAGLIFKGSGFYITDYRSENYKASAKKDSLAAPASSTATKANAEAKAATTKTESKPAAKKAD
jgi:putative FmdB family regulatory protein